MFALSGLTFTSEVPSAIRRFVVAVYVDTVKFCSRRPFAHVRKEVHEYQPLFTDRDSSTSVMFKAIIVFIQASLFHAYPRIIGAGLDVFFTAASFCMTMFAHGLFPKASTTFGVSSGQASTYYGFFSTALASANPSDAAHFISVRSAPNNGPTTESFSEEIYKLAHDTYRSTTMGMGLVPDYLRRF
jgi:hypothetical protein